MEGMVFIFLQIQLIFTSLEVLVKMWKGACMTNIQTTNMLRVNKAKKRLVKSYPVLDTAAWYFNLRLKY